MEDFFVNLFLSNGRMEGAILGAIIGTIMGALGALVGSGLEKLFKKEKIVTYTVIIFIVISFQIPKLIRPYVQEVYGGKYQENVTATVIEELSEQRLFAVIFKYHPEAKEQLAVKMNDIIFNAPEDQVESLSQAASAEIVSVYFHKHLPAASNEKTNELLKRNAVVLHQFAEKPTVCVNYFLGQLLEPQDISPEFIKIESEMKADLIESSINNPSVPPRAGSVDEILEAIARKYQEKNYPIENLQKLDFVSQLPPHEGCVVASQFSDALASFDVKQGAFIYKNLLYLSKE